MCATFEHKSGNLKVFPDYVTYMRKPRLTALQNNIFSGEANMEASKALS